MLLLLLLFLLLTGGGDGGEGEGVLWCGSGCKGEGSNSGVV